MRPKKKRIVKTPPIYCEFKPIGLPTKLLTPVYISLDEYEAVRLADYEGLQQEEAALEMNISRPTFTRLIAKARRKIATALIEGTSLVIEGGKFEFSKTTYRCFDCNDIFNEDILDGKYICPNCNSDNLMNLNEFFKNKKCHKHGKNSTKSCEFSKKGYCNKK